MENKTKYGIIGASRTITLTTTPQNTLNVIGSVNATVGFIVNSSTGMTGNYSVGSCWVAYKGGIAYETNCTAF